MCSGMTHGHSSINGSISGWYRDLWYHSTIVFTHWILNPSIILPPVSLKAHMEGIKFVHDRGMGSPNLTSIEEGQQHTALIDFYFGMFFELMVVLIPHLQLFKYIGCFSNLSSYFNDEIDGFIYNWAQVAEFVSYIESLTIDLDVGSWNICCKHNCLLNTDL